MLCPTAIVVLLLTGAVRPALIILLSLAVGITDALSMPSYQSIVPSLVERTRIAQGLALNSTQFNLSRILDPAIAGVLMTCVGAVGCFALSAASYIPFIGVALWILPRSATKTSNFERFHPWLALATLKETLGLRDVRGALLTVFAMSLLCGPLVTFVPVLVRNAFHGGVGQLSAAIGAFGVGGLLGALALLALPARMDRRRLSSELAAAHGFVLMLAALLPWLWGLPALMALAGAAMTMSNTSANALLQSTATPRLLGQTVSPFLLATRGGCRSEVYLRHGGRGSRRALRIVDQRLSGDRGAIRNWPTMGVLAAGKVAFGKISARAGIPLCKKRASGINYLTYRNALDSL
jgi:uncharacterized membrane protein YbaN (DUF454 family)